MDAERSLRHLSELSYRARSKRRRPLPGLGWLLVAVGVCWLSWPPAPAEAQPACAHDVCEEGGALSEVCDPCVDDICAIEPYCCDVANGAWLDFCVAEVLDTCGDVRCAQVCSHSPCETGDPLDSTCNSCTALVCFQDPNCCDAAGSWDASCVLKVQQECGYQCEPGADVCSNALPVHAGKILGTLLGSSNDGCESERVSCRSGDVWYSYTQEEAADDMVLSTCSTQRSFAIDTVLSVHAGCPGKPQNEIAGNDDWGFGSAPQACANDPKPKNVDAALSLGGALALDPGETVLIRVSHHDTSVRNNFELRILPEPEVWLALVAGAGALGALSRWRARG